MLKIIGFILMIVDHIGAFVPDLEIKEVVFLRTIGRLSAPIFIWELSKGLEYTKNEVKYCKRLLFYGGLAQIVFLGEGYNILLSFGYSVLIKILFYKRRIYGIMAGAIGLNIPFEYGFWGLFAPLMLYEMNKAKQGNYKKFTLYSAMTIAYSLLTKSPLQALAVFSPWIFLPFENVKIDLPFKPNKRIFYWLYILQYMSFATIR